MSNFIDVVNSEIKELTEESEMVLKRMRIYPKGQLRVSKCRKTVQYYYKTDGNNRNGKYIRKNQEKLVRQLAQKEYDEKLYSIMNKKLEMLKHCQEEYQRLDFDNLYEEIAYDKRKWITPHSISPDEYVKQWLAVEYRGKEIVDDAPLIYTEKGERVRSKSEKIIADKLLSLGIPYRYEYPIKLKGYGTIYPDFCILDVKDRSEKYLEHLGMMDNSAYVEHAISKINSYILNEIYPGQNLILTYETKNQPLDTRILDKMLKKFF